MGLLDDIAADDAALMDDPDGLGNVTAEWVYEDGTADEIVVNVAAGVPDELRYDNDVTLPSAVIFVQKRLVPEPDTGRHRVRIKLKTDAEPVEREINDIDDAGPRWRVHLG